jgi:light-regulated signal transduction histidine kinase (bacteriophytochrome)
VSSDAVDRSRAEAGTPFGEADLATCEHELIHIPGSVQPHGVLVVVSPGRHEILQASDNAATLLGRDASDLLGRRLGDAFNDELVALVRRAEREDDPETVAHGAVRLGERRWFASVHATPDQGLAIELEPAPDTPPDSLSAVSAVLEHVSTAASLERLCSGFAQLFRGISGYHRVMVYRFDADGHGEVFAEDRRNDLEPFLGNHYPASDIPQRARRLYVRNRVRILADVDAEARPVVPARSPRDGQPLDMSMCALRSLSPIHLQYLRNMGVAGTLVSSIMVHGQLWGLVACHHYEPRVPAPELRSLTELLSELLGVRISALASLARIQAELRVRSLERRMARAVSEEGDWRRPLLEEPSHLLGPAGASGAALLCDGETFTVGDVPATRDIRALARRLGRETPADEVYTTSCIAEDLPEFSHLMPDCTGLMATRISATDGDWILWFRPERVHTVTWAGDPSEAVIAADDLKSLTPRRSFAAWHQVVEGTAAPWSEPEEAFGKLTGAAIGDVLLQFRAVSVVIAREQLRRVDETVRTSGYPAAIVEPNGRISLVNRGFTDLFGTGEWVGRPLEELADRFVDGPAFLSLCRRVLDEHRLARVELAAQRGVEPVPVFVRADVIATSVTEILGLVVMFTDLSERRAALHARERFQRIVDSARDPIGAAQSAQAGEILDGLLEHATYAALELVQGIEVSEASDAIRALETSVQRTRRLLEEIVRGSRTGG